MKLIPDTVIAKVRELIDIFSGDRYSGPDYKDGLLELAETDEERADLQELFQNTDDFYNEKEKIRKSGERPDAYLKNMYLAAWKEEHPDASEKETEEAARQYEELMAEGVIKELEALESDAGQDEPAIIPDIEEDENQDNAKV